MYDKNQRCEYLFDEVKDHRCEFELLCDECASFCGYLYSCVMREDIQKELHDICELFYHMSPSLRTSMCVSMQDAHRICVYGEHVKEKCKHHDIIVLPLGCGSASIAHILRVKCKQLVRTLHIIDQTNQNVDETLFAIGNALSAYFCYLARYLNDLAQIENEEFHSKSFHIGENL